MVLLHCRATLTIGRFNGDIDVAAGYVIRNTLPPVPPWEYDAIGVIAIVKNRTNYAVNSVQFPRTYQADKSTPVQCIIDANCMAMAVNQLLYFAPQPCSDIGEPACEQFRLLDPYVALP